MNIEEKVRNLAKSSYWQSLYNSVKDCNGLSLFENTSNYSGIQILFLYWLKIYNLLYEELYTKEWPNLHEKMILDNIHCDAFLYWRGKELERRIFKYKEEERKSKSKNGKSNIADKSSGIFTGVRK
jgi:hypothetical protein